MKGLLASAMLLGCLLGAGPVLAAPPHFVEVPFTSCEGLICLQVSFAKGDKHTLILDTGDVNTFLAADVAKAEGFELQPFQGRDGKAIEGVWKTGLNTVHLGELALEVKMVVQDRKRLGGPAGFPADGGLVFPAFKDRILEIDYPRHLLRISDVLTDTAADERPGKLQTITFGKRGPAILTGGPFTIDGKPVQAQIDTGYTGTMVVYDEAIPKLGLDKIAKGGVGRMFPYTDGGVTMLGAAATSIGFATRTLADHSPTVYFPTPGVHQPDGLFEATVGNELFASSVVTLDFHHMSLDVTTTAAPSRKSAAAGAATIFAPGSISGAGYDSAAVFTPDGQTASFCCGHAAVSSLLESRREGAAWSVPRIAPFAGTWSNREARRAPDGSHLVFVANPPAERATS